MNEKTDKFLKWLLDKASAMPFVESDEIITMLLDWDQAFVMFPCTVREYIELYAKPEGE